MSPRPVLAQTPKYWSPTQTGQVSVAALLRLRKLRPVETEAQIVKTRTGLCSESSLACSSRFLVSLSASSLVKLTVLLHENNITRTSVPLRLTDAVDAPKKKVGSDAEADAKPDTGPPERENKESALAVPTQKGAAAVDDTLEPKENAPALALAAGDVRASAAANDGDAPITPAEDAAGSAAETELALALPDVADAPSDPACSSRAFTSALSFVGCPADARGSSGGIARPGGEWASINPRAHSHASGTCQCARAASCESASGDAGQCTIKLHGLECTACHDAPAEPHATRSSCHPRARQGRGTLPGVRQQLTYAGQARHARGRRVI